MSEADTTERLVKRDAYLDGRRLKPGQVIPWPDDKPVPTWLAQDEADRAEAEAEQAEKAKAAADADAPKALSQMKRR